MTKYRLHFPPEAAREPVIARVVLKTGALINILRAEVDYEEGVMVISIPGDEADVEKVIDALRAEGVEAERLEVGVKKDEAKCIDCGACVGLCPTGALSLGDEKELRIDNERCVGCEACLEACPFKALRLSA